MTSEALSSGLVVRSSPEGARGPKPQKITIARIGVYAFLVISALFFLMPLWVMVVTSLKGMPEIRLGHLFNWPSEITFDPWLKAWDTACTGRDCNGLKPGFWNSVKITALSVPVSIICAMINGYALSFWKYKGSELLFGILVFGAFVPYQVVIYPLIIGLSKVGLFATLPGIVIVHTIFGMPILTLLYRNFFASLPIELFKAGRVDGAGFWGIFFRIMLPMSVPITIVAIILQVTGIWN
ncbi:MAG: carbohydrate ABC transporter permease, partial [Alphaproteobacteria bacterium]